MRQNYEGLSFESCITFFGKYNGHSDYYQKADIAILLEDYLKPQDTIDLPKFIEDLRKCVRHNNITALKGRGGIHRETAGAGKYNWQPLKSFTGISVSDDMTRSKKDLTNPIEPSHKVHFEDHMVADI